VNRVRIDIPGKQVVYAITEQQRTISANRLTGNAPMYELTPDQITEIRSVLRRMIDL